MNNKKDKLPRQKLPWEIDTPWWGQSDDEKAQSGFEDDPVGEPCLHPGHNPPSHLYIPPGKIYRHVCPKCRFCVILRPLVITC